MKNQKSEDVDNILIKKLAIPILILFVLSFVAIVSVLLFTTNTLNNDEYNNSRHRMKYEMDSMGAELGQVIRDYGHWDEAVEEIVIKFNKEWIDLNVAESIQAQFGLEYVFVLSSDNKLLYAKAGDDYLQDVELGKLIDPEIFKMIDKTRAVKTQQPEPVDRILKVNSGWGVVATSTLRAGSDELHATDYDQSYVFIFIRMIDEGLLEEIGSRSLLESLHLDNNSSGKEISWEIPEQNNSNKIHFVWTAKKPGDQLLFKSIPWILAIFIGLFVFGLKFWKASLAAESALFKAKEQSEKMLRMEREIAMKYSYNKSQFLSNMSHEIKTPLNSILGFVQLIKVQDNNMTQEGIDNLNYIERSGKHLLNLVNDVADMRKIEEGGLKIELDEIDLNGVVIESIALVNSLANSMKVEIVNNISEQSTNVVADTFRLKQVVINLLSNAIKYNKVGGKVILDEKIEKDKVRLIVTDTGIGIDEENLKSIFEPFMRVNNDSKVEGTGIGLSITRRLLELMGADIEVTSKINIGTRVVLTIPTIAEGKLVNSENKINDKKKPKLKNVVNNNLDEVNTVQNKINPNKPSFSVVKDESQNQSIDNKYLKKLTIVYVEDNNANIALMRKFMKIISPNVSLLVETNAEDGYETIAKNKPDLVLTDLHLPGMSGHMLLEKIISNQEIKHVPVIAISANLNNDSVDLMKQQGFYTFISKPFNLYNLKDLFYKLDSEFFDNRS